VPQFECNFVRMQKYITQELGLPDFPLCVKNYNSLIFIISVSSAASSCRKSASTSESCDTFHAQDILKDTLSYQLLFTPV
jgi:hypothetical protein